MERLQAPAFLMVQERLEGEGAGAAFTLLFSACITTASHFLSFGLCILVSVRDQKVPELRRDRAASYEHDN